MQDLVLDEVGWDEHLGPKNAKLNQIYRKRLADPKLKPLCRQKMGVLSSFRDRFVELDLITPENPEVENIIDYAVNVKFGICNLHLA